MQLATALFERNDAFPLEPLLPAGVRLAEIGGRFGGRRRALRRLVG